MQFQRIFHNSALAKPVANVQSQRHYLRRSPGRSRGFRDCSGLKFRRVGNLDEAPVMRLLKITLLLGACLESLLPLEAVSAKNWPQVAA
jgi:hypothetical protein